VGSATAYLLAFSGGGLFFGWLVHASLRDGRAWGILGANDRARHPVRFWIGVYAQVLMTCLCTFGLVWSAVTAPT
jgi:hypothetical protein